MIAACFFSVRGTVVLPPTAWKESQHCISLFPSSTTHQLAGGLLPRSDGFIGNRGVPPCRWAGYNLAEGRSGNGSGKRKTSLPSLSFPSWKEGGQGGKTSPSPGLGRGMWAQSVSRCAEPQAGVSSSPVGLLEADLEEPSH